MLSSSMIIKFVSFQVHMLISFSSRLNFIIYSTLLDTEIEIKILIQFKISFWFILLDTEVLYNRSNIWFIQIHFALI